MAKRSTFGSSIRKRLSDITNYQPQTKSPPVFDQILSHNGSSSSSAKEYIDHLLKENAGLMKLIMEKNKIIESNGVELQKLQVVLQKMQVQNWNLAQSNSHMLVELNLGKQKVKTLQHELICKDALLKAKNLELENDTKRSNANRRRRPERSQSIGPVARAQRVSEKEMIENKRRCLRRQSARFGSQENEVKDNLFEIEHLQISRVDNMVQKDGEESRRTSFGRPSRRAAEKVHSYRETPLNIKMRRPE